MGVLQGRRSKARILVRVCRVRGNRMSVGRAKNGTIRGGKWRTWRRTKRVGPVNREDQDCSVMHARRS